MAILVHNPAWSVCNGQIGVNMSRKSLIMLPKPNVVSRKWPLGREFEYRVDSYRLSAGTALACYDNLV